MGILDGRAVVITGAGRGLGRAYAMHAAESGAAVVVNDVAGDLAEQVVETIRASGGRAVAGVGSVADPGQAAALVESCVAHFGAIDGLVNNARVRHDAVSWEDDPDRIRQLFDVNVLGTMYCGHAAARAMRGRGGVIVNVASGSMLGQPRAVAYSASKAAVASLTSAWAVEFAEHGIRVNAVCPLAWTPMAAADPRARTTPQDSPERIAPLVTYLLSDLASGVTGQIVRFVGDKLCVVRQPAIKEPVLVRDSWDVEQIAKAFDGDLAGAFEPPPTDRWTVTAGGDSAWPG
ncbi:SDR family NAD(P)-dependent oxidoreductase [Gandjariella thermophila]|uniref:Short-chain dehydrogenase n=1 Tax=Gandjariella thermophila TaxID=1931992 RepID=A0A4D4J6G5_9PSEU|nr:SDR family oxidoreductase [Gandjariella thermophila]GDY30702.1 short-chain dehydrogenase [Gandjariella thermophila]